MPIATAQGREFNFPDGTTQQQMGSAIDEFFRTQGGPGVSTRPPSPTPASGVGAPVATGLTPESILQQNPQLLAFRDQNEQELIAGGVDPAFARQESTRLALERGQGRELLGTAEVAAAIASGGIAEPLSGLAGILATPFGSETASNVVKGVQQGLTFQPKTEAGQRQLGTVAGALEPVGKALEASEEILGKAAFKATGSPALAAAAATLPTAILEALGLVLPATVVRSVRSAKRARLKGNITQELSEAVPTVDQLKDTSRAIFKEIDDLGAELKPSSVNALVGRLKKAAEDSGIAAGVTPKAFSALNAFENAADQPLSLTQLDNLRKISQNAAKSLDPPESAGGVALIDTVDKFLDEANPSNFSRAAGSTEDIGKRYKAARKLWGRARRSELLAEAFERARNQASGFENGIRTQFTSILNNRKQRRFFNPTELKAIKKVVRGTAKENIAKLVGKLGFSEGRASSLLVSGLGATAGGVVGGTPGAVIVPLIGQVSRKLAQRMTVKNAEFANQVIRAGKDARKITAAYIKNTPKSQRTSAELSELLQRNDINFNNIQTTDLAQQAAQLATQRRLQLTGALAAQGPAQEEVL